MGPLREGGRHLDDHGHRRVLSFLRRGPVLVVLALLFALAASEAGFAIVASRTLSHESAAEDARLRNGLAKVRALFRTREEAAAAVARRTAEAIAAGKLLPAPDRGEQVDLFRRLESAELPPAVSGVVVRDATGRPVAWRGRSYGLPADAPDRERIGISRSAVYRVLYAEVPVEEEGKVAGSVLAWSPFDLNYPLHNRYLRSGDFEEQVAARLGLKSIDVGTEPPAGEEPAEDARRLEGPLTNLRGEPIGRIAVEAYPAEVYATRIEYTGRGVRAVLLTLLLLAIAFFAARAALRPDARIATLAAFPVVATAARIGIFQAGFPRLVFSGPAFDPSSFSRPVEILGLATGFLQTPADLVLTGLLAVAVTAVLALAIARRLAPRLEAGRPRPVLAAGAGAAAIALSVLPFGAWHDLVHSLPWYSTVDFFSEQTVLPELPATLLLLGLFLLTFAWFVAVASAFALAARAATGRTGPMRLLVAAAAAAVVFAPLLAGADLMTRAVVIGTAAAALATAVAAGWTRVSAGLRIAGMTALVTLFTYLPLQIEVWRESRADVEDEADELLAPAEANPLRHRLASDLEDLADSPRLVRALDEESAAPEPRLAFRLWAESELARRPRGADLEILDASGTVASHFDIGMPPRSWLPAPPADAPTDRASVVELAGHGGGERQEFLVGTAPVRSPGGTPLGRVVVRVPMERPLLGRGGRPEILSSYEEGGGSGDTRELHYAEYVGDRLVATTNPEYPRFHRAPPDVVKAIYDEGEPSYWTREEIGGLFWISLYRPRTTDGRVTGMVSVSFRSQELRDLFLSFFKLLLVSLLAAVVGGIALALPRARRFELRFQHKLLLSYLVISVVPVLVLAELNRNIARETVEQQMRDTIRESVRLVRGELRDRGITSALASLPATGATREEVERVVSDERLKEIGYRLGQEVNLFVRGMKGEWGAPLVASSEPGIFATELFSDRLPGDAYLDTVLLGRDFMTARESVGDYSFLVGYSPILADGDRPVGAVSLPMIYGQDALDRELARRNSLIIVLYLVILFVVFLIGLVLARRISSPIERLAEGTRRLSAGDLTWRIPYRSQDEFGYLVESFNRMTEDLLTSRERIVKAEKDAAWREMAKQIAHEIKNPLTPMRLSAQHILRAYQDRHEDFEEILTRGVETIIRQTETLRRIAGEFSAFARLPTRRVGPVDAAGLAREVAGLYAGTGGVEVVEEISPVPDVEVDRDELKRVLVNLTTNAVQAMEGKPGTLTIRTDVVTTRYGGEPRELVRFAVEDTGVGIPPGDLAHLFEPSFSTKTGGTGLGLAISKAVVESFGGEIAVASELGRGTTVTVHLPARTTDGDA